MSESEFTSTRIGTGNSGMVSAGKYFIDGKNRDTYYSHGNSTVAESNFARSDGYDVYAVALSAGEEGNYVLGRVADPGKAYTASPSDLDDIFTTIAGSIAYAATNAVITDVMGVTGGDLFSIISAITVSAGSTSVVDDTITWTLGTISEITSPAEMSYVIQIDP